MVTHNLEIPECISPEGGNLADFAAQVWSPQRALAFIQPSCLLYCLLALQLTCLFWFETVQVHQAAEKIDLVSPSKRVLRLNQNAVPQPNFKRWVHSILSTTQVTQNVILLALLFVYRLKEINPGVKGRAGSEYRLLTVALMLGNKCEYC